MSFSVFVILTVCHINLSYSSSPSVIIVGAGPAGIAAATKLLEHSITNLTILEAEDRIGGRIHSVKFHDAFIDIGAQYVHGEDGNIVYQLAKDLDVLKPGLRLFDDNIYLSNGSKVHPDVANKIKTFFFEKTDDDDKTGKSVGEVFISKLNSSLWKNFAHDRNPKILKEISRFSEGFILQSEGSFSWLDTSADSDYVACSGNKAIAWDGHGYKTILEILMKSFPDPNKKLPIDDKIFFNKEVIKINWNDKLIGVQTTDNSLYTADHVIFTPSIGVLKEKKDQIFDPPLPSSKREAIEAVGFAAVMKIFMHFEQKWWNDDETISFFWKEEDIESTDFVEGPSKDGVSWIVQIRYVLQASKNPNVLVGWITGDLVPEIEKMPLETLRNGCNYVLKKFLNTAYDVTEIGELRRSTWYSNKHFRGVYSYAKTGLYCKNVSYPKILAEPLNGGEGKPVLLFAGEATSPDHYSTVHGAIETGYREAERIIQLYTDMGIMKILLKNFSEMLYSLLNYAAQI